MSAFDVHPQPGMPNADPAVVQQMYSRMGRQERAEAIDAKVDGWRSFAGTASPFDETWIRRRVTFAYDRAYRPEAVTRQMAAVLGSPSIASHHRSISAPTRVVLGDVDPLVPLAQGTALAAAIQTAELSVVPGMGHELPPALWPQLLDAISSPIRS
jgi:pimeloyl-ACP methyl ester carboxylesterase